MRRLCIFRCFSLILLASIFVGMGTAYGYIVIIKAVFSEHLGYETKHFNLGEATYIFGGIGLADLADPLSISVTVEWDTTEKVLPYAIDYGGGSAGYNAVFGYVPPTSFSDWENKTYTFKVDGFVAGDVFVPSNTLRQLSLPVAIYDDNSKTVSWQSVEFADEYRVRILRSTNVDDFLFDSIRLGPDVNQFSFDPAYHYILENGAIIAVEARDWNPPFDFLSNTSIYVTRSASNCGGDFNRDGKLNMTDLSIFTPDFGRSDCDQNGGCDGDMNGDNDIDGSDFAQFIADFGRVDCPFIRLTTHSARDFSPSWSPDNSKIAFGSERSGAMNLWTMNIDGTNKVELTDNLGWDNVAHWSADSSKLVFHSDRSGNWDIWGIDSDGSDLVQLTDDPGDDYMPDFSPDDSKIVFQSNRSGNYDIWMMDSDGANPTRISNASYYEGHPDFSPDGSKIVYRVDESNRGDNFDIWIMDSDGSNAVRLTNTSEHEGHPHFSPDGSKILFHSEKNGNREIWVMSVDGSEKTQFTYNSAIDSSAYWSPNGNKLVFFFE